MNLRCLLFGHIPDKSEVIENFIPFTPVHCIRCGKMIYYITARWGILMTKLYMILTDDWNQDFYGIFSTIEKARETIKDRKSKDNMLKLYDFYVREVILDEWDE